MERFGNKNPHLHKAGGTLCLTLKPTAKIQRSTKIDRKKLAELKHLSKFVIY